MAVKHCNRAPTDLHVFSGSAQHWMTLISSLVYSHLIHNGLSSDWPKEPCWSAALEQLFVWVGEWVSQYVCARGLSCPPVPAFGHVLCACACIYVRHIHLRECVFNKYCNILFALWWSKTILLPLKNPELLLPPNPHPHPLHPLHLNEPFSGNTYSSRAHKR